MADEEEEKKYADVGDWEGMEKRIQNLEDAVASLKKDHEEIVGGDEVEEMAEPSSLPKTITTKEVKEFSIEELQAENKRLKIELAESPASAPLDTNKFSSETTKVSLSKKELSKMTKKEKYIYNLYNN